MPRPERKLTPDEERAYRALARAARRLREAQRRAAERRQRPERPDAGGRQERARGQ